MKKTKIVCTLGPAVDNEKYLKEMINAGMNVARLNFSHGDHIAQQERVDRLKKVKKEINREVALLLDTKGPEIRIGTFKNNAIELNEGEFFVLYNKDIIGNENGVSITHKTLYKYIKTGDKILINDGLVVMVVVNTDNKDIVCKVIHGGVVSNNKGINIPDVDVHLPSLTEKDINDILFAVKNDFDYIAASFIRKAEDVIAVKEVLEKNNAGDIKIISKIENREGVDNFDEILDVSDGIMVARGDLGVEIPFEEIPYLQKIMCDKCNKANKIVIVATQMLESMTNNPRPTRAEVSDVANAIYDGATAIMLSGESAAGKYPIESVETMAKIASCTESEIQEKKNIGNHKEKRDIISALAVSAVVAAKNINASAIICITESGEIARHVSFENSNCPIFAVTNKDRVIRQLMLNANVYPVKLSGDFTMGEVITICTREIVNKNVAKIGDKIVIVSEEITGNDNCSNGIKIIEL